MAIDRQLIPIKLQYFFLSGASGCLLPFLPLYFKSIGFSATQSAIIFGVMPFAAGLFNPLVGSLSDKWKCHKVAIVLSCLLSASGHIGVKLLPMAYEGTNHTSNNSQEVDITANMFQFQSPFNSYNNGLSNHGLYLDLDKPVLNNIFSQLFIFIFILEIISYGASEPAAGLTDALTYKILGEERRGDYGKQHILAAVGYPIVSTVCGVLIDVTTKVSGNSTYTYLPLFSFYVFFMLCVCFNTCAISANGISRNSNFGHDFGKLIKNLELLCHFFITVIFGILCGVSISFLTWFLQSLGASNTVIGTSSIVFCVFELPTLFFAGNIMNRIGMVNTMYLTFIIYCLRYLGYSFMSSPWFIYAVEPLHGATSALMFTVTSAYAVSKAPPDLTAAATGFTYGSQLLGRGIGSIAGGVVYDTYGPRILFWGCSVLSSAGIVILGLCRLLSIQCHPEEMEERSPLLTSDGNETRANYNTTIQS